MFDQMKQLMEMRKMAQEAERSLDGIHVQKSALGGKLSLSMNGHHRVKDLSIDDSLLHPGQRPVLEKGLAALFQDAADAVKREAAARAMDIMRAMKQ